MTVRPLSNEVVALARGWLGTPYHHQASVKGAGCDCLGLVRGIWRELYGSEPQEIPAYSPDWGEVGKRETLLEAGAEVFPACRAGPARPWGGGGVPSAIRGNCKTRGPDQ
ncbi:hypothetical protein ACMG4P_11260 [Pseudovibrio denitrificans]|uniref:hypothetical protein n=1 Tax=Pseudovibrio denitrificans TaxID=258256 RepID=UPI0039BF925F